MFDIQKPTWFPARPRVNFITLHYIYIMGFTIIGSIMLYPVKNIKYIDALFFASGASTQSGLNTVDVNLLSLYQQIVLMLIPWFCNPITINTAVVFIRLYWFEKRFDTIVEQSKQFTLERRTMSRRKSESDGVDRAERGVAGRTITVVFNSARKTENDDLNATNAEKPNDNTTSGNKGLQEFRRNIANGTVGPHRPITFGHYSFGRSHARSKSDTNHRIALSQSKPGGLFTVDSNNEYAIEDDEDHNHNGPAPPSPGPNELSGILEKAGEASAPAGHISFADPRRKPRRKDSEVYMVPSVYDVENRGSVVARKFMDGDEGDELVDENKDKKNTDVPDTNGDLNGGLNGDLNGNTDKDEKIVIIDDNDKEEDPKPVDETAIHMKRAITIDEPSLTHNTTHTGPRQRLRPINSKTYDPNQPPVSPGINRIVSDAFRKRRNSSPSRRSAGVIDKMPYLSYTPTVGRNSQFNYGELTDEQKEELGGVEYRSLRTLAYILVGYFLFFQVFGLICILPWINGQLGYTQVVENAGLNKNWWAVFTASSAFTDLGFTLTPDSMVSFNTATWLLLIMSYLIIIGNTGFPCMLRFIIWVLWKICPKSWVTKESLHFLLDHPRRCFTLLFPSKATWWLFAILIVLNVTDVLLFIILDLHDGDVTSLSVGTRILDAFFQAVSTRTAGFSVINLALIHPAVQVSYLVMMYISVFPIAISVRRTNVYEERSLGIYANNEETDDPNNQSFVGAHLRKQLSFDLWYVFVGLFLICIAEGGRIANSNDYAFTQFSCLFEVISAYGTVGLSLGYPDFNTSFSGQFGTFSKIVIMAMMIRGRHRGLPYELDRAILLPSESLQAKEEQDAAMRLQRRTDTLERRSLRPLSRGTTHENGRAATFSGGETTETSGLTTGYQLHSNSN